MVYLRDTIAARATAPGKGGIGIVRVSGPAVVDIALAVIGELPPPRYAALATFLDEDGSAIDSGIALLFKAPASFTGEDVLELHGHGGPVVMDMLLDRLLSLGARLAAPGEFTQRAFLNDKIDLAQAEAIADLIDSGSREAARGAIRSLKGEFSERVNTLVQRVTELRIFVEAAIDFPEEEIDFLSDDRLASALAETSEALDQLLGNANQGALLAHGASVVIVGKPNAGKSSLMNYLSGQDTAIVTDIPGTTRDLIDTDLIIDGIPLRLVDTAGIRASRDVIEAEGVRRAVEASRQADLTIALVDAGNGPVQAAADVEELATTGFDILVFNKIDLLDDQTSLASGTVKISAKTGQGMEMLRAQIAEKLGHQTGAQSTFSARRRHIDALVRAAAALNDGVEAMAGGRSGELLAEDLRQCQLCLSEITGEFTADDLLGEIFSSFCIGK